MAKDPAFLFYPNDFLGSTQFFSDEQVGKYIRLLIAQHTIGHLKEEHMMHICKTYDKDIFLKFKKDESGCFFNERLEKEILKRKEYSKSRSDNRKNKKDMKNISKTYDLHMENRNGIRNINEVYKPLKAKKFSENSEFAIFEDGSEQKLGQQQALLLSMGELKPHDIVKGYAY